MRPGTYSCVSCMGPKAWVMGQGCRMKPLVSISSWCHISVLSPMNQWPMSSGPAMPAIIASNRPLLWRSHNRRGSLGHCCLLRGSMTGPPGHTLTPSGLESHIESSRNGNIHTENIKCQKNYNPATTTILWLSDSMKWMSSSYMAPWNLLHLAGVT